MEEVIKQRISKMVRMFILEYMIVCVRRYDAAQFSLHYKSHITQLKVLEHALMTLKCAVFLVHSFGALMLCMLDFLCSKHMYVYDTL